MTANGTEDFIYQHDGLELIGQIALPDGPGPHPAVLIAHSAFGIDDLVRNRASDLAALGYVGLAVDMYGAGPGKPVLGEHHSYFMALQETQGLLRARIVAAYEALSARPEVRADRIAAIGYCFGGQCALELARSGADLRSVVSFHGLLTTQDPAKPGTVKAKLLALTGAHDPFVSAENVASFQQEMTDAKADWQVTIYGEGYHSFTARDIENVEVPGMGKVPGVRYDPFLDRLSWAQATAFLEATLKA